MPGGLSARSTELSIIDGVRSKTLWRTEDGVVHFNRIAMPGHYIADSLRERLDALPDFEKVELYYSIDSLAGQAVDVIASAGDVDFREEASFDGEWLPDSYRLEDSSSQSLEALLVSQAEQIPNRWRVEFIMIASTYLLDTGPKWRRWKKITRKLSI